ncbi:hypothetical protein J4E85_011537 [Alternaria conjuncta]|uniref:uncharacterized protein n=1 Tax=Alternaria conjuncta TaxID=181017 RepID=UPI00221FFEDD|nr:uncharacterized protein J4E85_011537 [Alternaria conjuncta]KAI4909715.1 hypothetical protein J4E85_011537 [Alternaria conjuncta]
MPPLFPHQAVMFRPSTSMPQPNEVLDSILTGYLWGCLLITLFLFTYFAISFCAWVLSAVLASIDTIVDFVRTYCDFSDASIDVEMMDPIWLEKYTTENLEQLARPDEITRLKCTLHEYDTVLQDAHSADETAIPHLANTLTNFPNLPENLFLRKPRLRMRQIPLNAKPMLDIRIQEHLVRNGVVLEDILRLAPLLSWEDGIGF